MREYEMRLHRPNGILSVVMKTLAIDDNDARRAASQFLIGDIVNARIFSGDRAVGLVQRALGWSVPSHRAAVPVTAPVAQVYA